MPAAAAARAHAAALVGPWLSNSHIPRAGRPAMFKDAEELIRHMELRHWLEKEDLEFKSGVGWSDLRPKLVKTALAMANL